MREGGDMKEGVEMSGVGRIMRTERGLIRGVPDGAVTEGPYRPIRHPLHTQLAVHL